MPFRAQRGISVSYRRRAAVCATGFSFVLPLSPDIRGGAVCVVGVEELEIPRFARNDMFFISGGEKAGGESPPPKAGG
jgi:hypothetical protein